MAGHALSGTLSEPRPQNQKEVNELVKEMEDGLKKGKSGAGFNCRKTTFKLEGKDMDVHSWKFNDWDYKKETLPTNARGLFTYRNPVTGHHEIVIRGYDKFFNNGEVNKTQWGWIKENTKAPYELTVKENGCIIFISGLQDDTLLVCSKHSTGSRGDVELSHAVAGEKWVDKHLASVGKTRAELSKVLRELNATAVAELCDDSFEEHILAYTEGQAGLYLHGINFNLPKFATCSQSEVQKFAERFGMRKTDYFELNDVDSLKKFLEDSAETGSWDGKDVEGFVIRCKAREGPKDPNWHDWFFKYKFEEPYLMYRQWREVTKSVLSGKEPRYKKHVEVTKEYLAFARTYFKQNPQLGKEYLANHGIIKVRDAFLEARGVKGSDLVKVETDSEVPKQGDGEAGEAGEAGDVKVVLVPVASIGCGKTTLAIALSRLFKWGHVQNDNFGGPKRPPRFAYAVREGLKKHPVVIADRNNHQKRERRQIFDDVGGAAKTVKFVALQYVHDVPGANAREYTGRIRKITRERVFNRGDNHQTILSASQPKQEIIKIMDGFVKRFEPVEILVEPDWHFDSVIDLDIEADSRTNLETTVLHLRESYPQLIKEIPTAEQMDEAIQFALKEYQIQGKLQKQQQQQQQQQKQQQTNTTELAQRPKKEKPKPIEYFAIQLPHDEILNSLTAKFESLDPERSAFFNHLKTSGRIQDAFHVTLIHRASLKNLHKKPNRTNQRMWDEYLYMTENSEGPVDVKIKLDKVVWDRRLMAIAVKLEPERGRELQCANEVPHITIGTNSPQIKPVESNNVMGIWKAGGENGGIEAEDLGGVEIGGKINVVYAKQGYV